MTQREDDMKKFGIFILVLSLVIVNGGAQAQNPYARQDDTRITLFGTVAEVNGNRFKLDYGEGTIIVETDGRDWNAGDGRLEAGDRVTVFGMVDKDLYETTTLEARSVYVERLGAMFQASPLDEEDNFYNLNNLSDDFDTVLQGTVSGVGVTSFTLDRENRRITVEVDDMAYNPLDEEGYQRVEEGDVVSVTGSMSKKFFEGRVLEAESVVTVRNTGDNE